MIHRTTTLTFTAVVVQRCHGQPLPCGVVLDADALGFDGLQVRGPVHLVRHECLHPDRVAKEATMTERKSDEQNVHNGSLTVIHTDPRRPQKYWVSECGVGTI